MVIILVLNPPQFIHGISLEIPSILFQVYSLSKYFIFISSFLFFIVPKTCFKEFGYFARMIFEKLRQDFLDIYPNEIFIRNSYIKYLKTNQSNENQISTYTKQSIIIKHNNDLLQNILSTKNVIFIMIINNYL
jgi:hypothetical protein